MKGLLLEQLVSSDFCAMGIPNTTPVSRYKIFLHSVDAICTTQVIGCVFYSSSEALQLHGKREMYYDLNESG